MSIFNTILHLGRPKDGARSLGYILMEENNMTWEEEWDREITIREECEKEIDDATKEYDLTSETAQVALLLLIKIKILEAKVTTLSKGERI